jgi:hypothetical protein
MRARQGRSNIRLTRSAVPKAWRGLCVKNAKRSAHNRDKSAVGVEAVVMPSSAPASILAHYFFS